jgi:TonB family protein
VVVEFVIGTDASVTDATVLRSVPDLDEAALEAVRRFSFTPAVKDGHLVTTTTTAPMGFRMQKTPRVDLTPLRLGSTG